MTNKRKTAATGGSATMVQQGDEQGARLKHQGLFLHARGLMSPEVADLKRQLLLLERLTGKDASKLDPRVADRVHGELEKATMEQLQATGLLEEWLTAWETRAEIERSSRSCQHREPPAWFHSPPDENLPRAPTASRVLDRSTMRSPSLSKPCSGSANSWLSLPELQPNRCPAKETSGERVGARRTGAHLRFPTAAGSSSGSSSSPSRAGQGDRPEQQDFPRDSVHV